MSEISDVVQIIRVEFEGVELAMKVGSSSIKTIQKGAKLLLGLLNFEKTKGKTGLKKLLLRGGDLQIFQFDEKDLKQVEKLCKKYGILYSLVPKLDKESNMRELLFHAEATPRVNMMLGKMKDPGLHSIKTMDTFLNETDDAKLGVFNEYLKEESKQNPDIHAGRDLNGLLEKVGKYVMKRESASVDEIRNELEIPEAEVNHAVSQLSRIGALSTPDAKGAFKVLMSEDDFEKKIKRLSELNERMRYIAAEKNDVLEDITIAKKMIADVTKTQIKTRVPGTWGDKARYIWIDKKDAIEVHGGKTILSFLEKERNYELFDKYDNRVSTITGKDLFSAHYSKVDKSLRERYEKGIRPPVLNKEKVVSR